MNIFGRRRWLKSRESSTTLRHRKRRLRVEPLEVRAMLTVATGDFNGDGWDDLAIGVSLESLPDGGDANGKWRAGAVNVIYGGENGLAALGNQFWNQDSAGINGIAGSGEHFGRALTVGDFDGDGYDDLAIGVPDDTVDGLASAGSVNVIYGSEDGLRARDDQLWTQNSPGIDDRAAASEQFGSQLTTGDFDGDGWDDLAIGVPNEDIGAAARAGAVNVIYGSEDGLRASGDQFWHQDVAGINGVSQQDDLFGDALVAGDFNDDGRDDLAIGVRQDLVGGVDNAGAVNVIYGSRAGLTATDDQWFHEDTPGINDSPEASDFFGDTLATGDFDHDGVADLAIAAPLESGSVGGQNYAGMIFILFGGEAKLLAIGSQSLTRLAFPALNATVARIGDSLAAGDFNNDGADDLVIGAAFAQVNGFAQAGLLIAVYGSDAGLDMNTGKVWHQNTGTVQGAAELSDQFGAALATGDFDGDNDADLVVAVPQETVTALNGGMVHIIYGSDDELTDVGNQIWAQGLDGILGDQENGDNFGR
jgi:hypothetical protein